MIGFLSGYWIWILLISGMLAMHLGHRGHGGHAGHGGGCGGNAQQQGDEPRQVEHPHHQGAYRPVAGDAADTRQPQQPAGSSAPVDAQAPPARRGGC